MSQGSRLQPLARAVLRTQSDERLVTLARRGMDAAFEEIVRRYRPALVPFAAAYGPPDPEDVVQESLARAWQALRDSTEEMHVKPWLYTIVRNRALNARRDARPTEPLADQAETVAGPAEIALTNDELDRSVAAIVALPEAQRQALVRSALEGHTHEQIAATLGSSPGAVRQLIYRARLTVRHGVGLVIPLPLVQALVQASSDGAAAAGAGVAVGGGAAVAGGSSLAAKALVIAAAGAIAAGSGIAIERSRDHHDPNRDHPAAVQSDPADTDFPAATGATPTPSESDSGQGSSDDRSGEAGDDGHGSGPSGGSSEHGSGGSQGSGGEGSGAGADDSGASESSGPGPGPNPSGEDSSGEDSSGEDSSEEGSSGSGSGSNSGHGSGSSGSGSGSNSGHGSGSSGSGSSGSSDDASVAPEPPQTTEAETESEDHSGSSDSSGSDDSVDSSGSDHSGHG